MKTSKIEFSDRPFRAAHGKAPKNVFGMWFFKVVGKDLEFSATGTLSEAKAKVARDLEDDGYTDLTLEILS